MLGVETAKWQQTLEDLRRTALQALHPRTRERFQALYLIASGQFNATTCAAHIGRQDDTVLTWIHLYNRQGPQALTYRHSGGRAPLLPSNKHNNLWPPWKTLTQPPTACPVTTGP
jgi:hypothetical protein